MKRTLSLFLAALLILSLCGFQAFADDQGAGKTPEEVLEQMTTEEKIAQMLMPSFEAYIDEREISRV